MNVYERRLAALERQCAADLKERMLQIAASELDVDPEELRREAEQLAMEARAFPSAEAHIAHVAAVLNMTVDDLEQTACRLEAAALKGEAA